MKRMIAVALAGLVAAMATKAPAQMTLELLGPLTQTDLGAPLSVVAPVYVSGDGTFAGGGARYRDPTRSPPTVAIEWFWRQPGGMSVGNVPEPFLNGPVPNAISEDGRTWSTGGTVVGPGGGGDIWGTPISSKAKFSSDGSVRVGRVSLGYERTPTRWTLSNPNGYDDLGLLPGTVQGETAAVSANGSVIVGHCVSDPVASLDFSPSSSFRWTEADGIQSLGTLPGFTSTRATCISGDGTTIYGFAFNDVTAPTINGKVWRWTALTGMVDLGLATTWTPSSGTPMWSNADGSSLLFDNQLWSDAGGAISLMDAFAAQSLLPLGATQLRFDQMTFSGRLSGLVSFGPDAADRLPFIATIPNPSTAALLGVFSVFGLCRRRRSVPGQRTKPEVVSAKRGYRSSRVAVLGGVLLTSTANGQPSFSVIDRVPGVGNASTAVAISRDGSRVKGSIGYFLGIDDIDFTWTRAGGVQLITAPNGTGYAYGSGASISGDGRSYGVDFDPSTSGQWLFRDGDTAIEVGTPGAYTNIAKISHDGTVVAGWTDSLPDGVYVWTAATGRTHLGVPGGIVTGMSASGESLVGWANDETSWTWSQQHGLRTIVPAHGTSSVRLTCMSADGTVAYGYSDSPSGQRAVSLIDGILEDALFSGRPIQLSSDATVLLTAYTVDGMTRTGLLDGPGNFTDLHQFFAASGLVPPGFEILNFRDMSGDGMTFVGDGRDLNGFTRGFVATIPSPSALALLAGSTMIGFRRRRRPGMICAASTLAVVCQAGAQPTEYRIDRAGFFDADHTSIQGIRYSELSPSANGGAVFGSSYRFLGQDAFLSGTLFPRGGVSAWMYRSGTSIQLGFLDGVHTSPSSFRSSTVVAATTGGLATGSSIRFNTSGESNGTSAWMYAGGLTTRIGLLDAEHTATSGQQSSIAVTLNDSAAVVGSSTRYSGAAFAGTSTWNHSAGNSVRTGLFGTEHTRSDGFQESGFASTAPLLPPSSGNDLNQAGQSIGWSRRYVAGIDAGWDAWVHREGTTTQLGLVDAEHTSAGGLRQSVAMLQNESGDVVGRTRQLSVSFPFKYSTWVHSGGVTTRVGLLDAEHTGSSGRRNSTVVGLSEAGAVAGTSTRYAGFGGSTAWLYSSGLTTRLGLPDGEHTSSNGDRSSLSRFINEAGTVVGSSNRYAGLNTRGTSTWLYSAATGHQRIGLVDAEHTGVDGSRSGLASKLTESGYVLGESTQYAAGSEGQSAWVFNGTTTIRAGLTDADHTATDSRRVSSAITLNESGDAIGTSRRLGVAGDVFGGGSSGWFFDSGTNSTLPLIFSLSSLGIANTMPQVLTSNSIVLGEYTFYNEDDSTASRMFWWSQSEGLFDLGALVGGGLNQAGWERLGQITSTASDASRIAGIGWASSDPGFSQGVYVMTAVPSPSAAVLFVGAAGSVGLRRRRRTFAVATAASLSRVNFVVQKPVGVNRQMGRDGRS